MADKLLKEFSKLRVHEIPSYIVRDVTYRNVYIYVSFLYFRKIGNVRYDIEFPERIVRQNLREIRKIP